MAMLTEDRSLPASADLSAESSWPSLSWLKVREPCRTTALLAAAGVPDEPVELFEHAAGSASSASVETAARVRSLLLIAGALHRSWDGWSSVVRCVLSGLGRLVREACGMPTSQALGEPVVGLVPADLPGET